MAAPVAYRTHENKYAPSFPPVVYYRDTYGLDDERISACSVSDNDSICTKSTIRTTLNIHPSNGMIESMASRCSNMTPSYHVERIVTTRVLTNHARTLFTLSLISFASAIQLLIFATICLFYDGCPYWMAIIISFLLIFNTIIILIFTRCYPTRKWLLMSCIATSLSFIQSIALFLWTAYLVNNEDKYNEELGTRDNRIVHSTRIAMYSLQMIFTPIHAISSAVSAFFMFGELKSNGEDKITKGYFLTEPTMGHQKILVPIELRQICGTSEEDMDDASIGVQTSGSRPT